jgi:hypothetical protein
MKRSPNEQRAWERFKQAVGPNIWSTKDLLAWIAISYTFGVLGGFVLGLASS